MTSHRFSVYTGYEYVLYFVRYGLEVAKFPAGFDFEHII